MSFPYPLVFSTLGSPGWSLERASEQAVADGYAGLEVRILDGQVIPPDLPDERRAAIRSLMKEHGLVIAGIGASTRFSSPDADDRAKHLADLRGYLALASDLEVPIVRTFGGGPSEGQTMDDVIDLVAASLTEAAPDAERHGVTSAWRPMTLSAAGRRWRAYWTRWIRRGSKRSGTCIIPSEWVNRPRIRGTTSVRAWPMST